MELGNMMFGNSRGSYPIERGQGWEHELARLFDAYASQVDEHERGYGPEFENETFAVMPYYWGDCTCGFDERDWHWSETHKHADDCYQTRLRNEVAAFDKNIGYNQPNSLEDAFYVDREPLQVEGATVGEFVTMTPRADNRSAYKKHSEFDEAVRKRLCAELSLPFPSGSAVHCTCTHDAEYAAWRETDDHDPRCPLVVPNFLYKPTGFEIQWYKYPLRDSYKNQKVPLAAFREMIDVCIASVGPSA